MQHLDWPTFKSRFIKNLLFELHTAFNVVTVLLLIVYGVFHFLYKFPIVKLLTDIIKWPLLFFLIGRYLTHFPLFLVVVIALLPWRYASPILFIGFVAMFVI